MNRPMKATTAASLAVAAAVALLLSLALDRYDSARFAFWTGYTSNISAGFVTTAAIVYFIERALEQREEITRKRLEHVAAQLMEVPINRLLLLFECIIIAAAPKPLLPRPLAYGILFSEENLAHLDWLDLDAQAHEPRAWAETMDDTLRQSVTEIRDVARAYQSRLNVQLLIDIEMLRDHSFYWFMLTAYQVRRRARAGEPNAPTEGMGLNGMAEARSEFFALLQRITQQVGIVLGQEFNPLRMPSASRQRAIATAASSSNVTTRFPSALDANSYLHDAAL